MNRNEKKELNINELEQVNGGIPDFDPTKPRLDVEAWERGSKMIKAVLKCVFKW